MRNLRASACFISIGYTSEETEKKVRNLQIHLNNGYGIDVESIYCHQTIAEEELETVVEESLVFTRKNIVKNSSLLRTNEDCSHFVSAMISGDH